MKVTLIRNNALFLNCSAELQFKTLWPLPQATLSLTELSEVICKERAQKAAWFPFPKMASLLPSQKAELFTFLSAFRKGSLFSVLLTYQKKG